jgi:hypothetical protein
MLLTGACAVLLIGPLAFGAVEPWSIFGLEACAMLLLVAWACRQWINRELLVFDNVLYRPMAAFFALALVQWLAGTTVYRFVTYSQLLRYAAYGMLVFVVTQSLRRSSQFEMVAKLFAGPSWPHLRCYKASHRTERSTGSVPLNREGQSMDPTSTAIITRA